jgi:hypothetical protein
MAKRSDIPTRLVLEAYALDRSDSGPVDEIIAYHTAFPHKVIWAALEREEKRGYLECGVNLRWGWLTDKGKARMQDLRAA